MSKGKKTRLSKEEIKELKITSKTSNKGRDLAQFMPIVEMIARKEYQAMPSQMMNYDELVNSGLIAVNKLIEAANASTKEDIEYNSSYISQSVKWAIKDELRSRQSWVGVKRTEAKKKARDSSETTIINSMEDARKAVFEVIMSVEQLEEDAGISPSDSPEYLENMALLEMKNKLKEGIKKLPDNLQEVIELRFYEDMSGNEVAEKLGVTPSRISHMINEAVKKLKVIMIAQGYSSDL